MNNIDNNQNSTQNIELLKAQRRLYSLSRRLAFANFLVSVPLIIFTSIVATFITGFSVWFGYVALVALIAGKVLDSFSSTYKEKAAVVQNIFDSNVLEFDTNRFVFSCSVEPEEIKYHADRISETDNQGFDSWYPPEVSVLPIAYARLLCQRANCHWNLTQRIRYIAGLAVLGACASIAIVGLGITAGTTLEDLLLYVVDLSPTIRAMTTVRILLNSINGRTHDEAETVYRRSDYWCPGSA